MVTTDIRQRVLKALLLAVILTLVLAACRNEQPAEAPAEEPTEAAVVEEATVEPEPTEAAAETVAIDEPVLDPADMTDRLWVLVGYGDALNPTVVEEGIVITALFGSAGSSLSGSSGCNRYFGGFTAGTDGGLSIDGPLGSTTMACETGMETEATYLTALEAATNWALSEAGRLEITYDSGQPFEEKLVYVLGQTPLTDTTWRLVSFGDPEDPTPVLEGTAVTALFTAETESSGTVSGNSTCNNYFGSYELNGDTISFGPIGGTLRACAIGDEQELAFLAALQSAEAFEIVGSNLRISYEGGVLNFSSLNLPLENVLWQAVMIGGLPVPEGVEVTALFTPGDEAGAGTVGGNAGCNSYRGGYETTVDASTTPPTNSLTFDGPFAVTLMACPDEEVAQLEQSYLSALETATTYTVLGDQLVISTENGDIQFAAYRQPLLGTFWTLVSLGDVENPEMPVEGSNFTAQFSRLPELPTGTVTGETGCNDYNATFTANATEIKVNLPSTTQQECGEGQRIQEQQFFLGLNAASTYRIVGSSLQILYGESDTQQALNFVASEPPVEMEDALDLTPLQGTFWYLSAFGDTIVLPGTEITAQFNIDEGGTTGTISGSAGCNGYNAAIGTNFAIGPIATTFKACEQAVMAQESMYLSWLADAFAFNRAGDQLLVSTAQGVLTFNSTPILNQANELVDRTWFLTAYETSTVIRGTNPTATFARDGSLGGTTGCNNYTGTYTAAQGNTLIISDLSSTLTACASAEVGQQEAAFLRLMPTATSYSINGTALQIVTSNGATLNFTSETPEEARPPRAVIVSEASAEVGQVLTFDGSQSERGTTRIVSYSWNMGDGVTLSGPTVQYAYNTPGTYTVELTVVDRAGLSNSTRQSVLITAVPQVTPPTAAIEGPSMAFVGETVTFSAGGSQPGTSPIASFQWQSGDGNNTGSIPDNQFTTIYTRPGVYFPTVTVVDANGFSDSASLQIVVNASLVGTTWIYNGAIPETSITLEFANGNLSGFAGCNSYSAEYSTTLMAGPTNNITVGPIIAGGALCAEEIMVQEQTYLAALQTASSYTISGESLTLTTESGPLTFFAAIPTPFAAPAEQ